MPQGPIAPVAPIPPPESGGAAPASAGAVVMRTLRSHVGELLEILPEAAEDAESADRHAHALRVLVRRIRSTLRAFAPALDSGVAGHLDDELTWLAGSFSDVRDAQVIRLRMVEALGRERAGAVSPSGSYLLHQIDDGVRAAAGVAFRAAGSARAQALAEELDSFLAHPPMTADAATEVPQILAPTVHQELRRVRKRAARALDSDDRHRDELLHDLRKAAKRARYTCEALDEHGDLGELTKTLKNLQDLLGEHNDCLAAQRYLVELADRAHQAGQETFLHGRLHAREEVEAEATLRDLPRQLERLRARARAVERPRQEAP